MKKRINRKVGFKIIYAALLIAVLAMAYGVYGMFYNHDILSGKEYDEMEGMLPFLVLLLAFPFLLIAFIVRFLMKR